VTDSPQAAQVVGRLAPSPTGAQHVGNARTYLLAWLSIRSRGGRLILRIEDIDSPRIKRGAAEQAIEDLCWLGLDWDEGPDLGGPHAPYVQTQRLPIYRDALDRLRVAELVYPCTCTRSDVSAAASAPHAGQEGPVYPGTCAHRTAAVAAELTATGKSFAWRFRATSTPRTFTDLVAGPQTCIVSRDLGDFVVAKADGSPAYQLAVVVDDHAMRVTEVLRGDDLLPSAFRQHELYEALDWTPPAFAHVPLVVGPDGRRLAKRHGDTRLATLRAQGVSAQRLVGLLAWSCGLIDRLRPVAPAELLADFSLDRLPRQAWVFDVGQVFNLP
jgi:glutamyl-tRNA synthetase